MPDSPPSPQQKWVRPSLGTADMNDMFDQIRKGLNKYNQRQQSKSKGTHRFINKYAPLRKPAAAANSTAATARSSNDNGDRPILFRSQLTSPSASVTSDWSPYFLPKVKPTPAPLTFDPPTFVLSSCATSSSDAALRPLKKTTALPVHEDEAHDGSAGAALSTQNLEGTAKEDESHDGSAGAAEALSTQNLEGTAKSSRSFLVDGDDSSSSPLQDQADGNATRTGKRKSDSDTETLRIDTESCVPNEYGMYSYPHEYGMYSYCSPYDYGQKKMSKREVDDLVAFARKWIPDVKKRRLSDKD